MTSTCAHDWQPIVGWYARYRCAVCRVIGYKPGAVHPRQSRSTAVVPYRCGAMCGRQACGQSALHAGSGKKFRCAVHARGGRAPKARETLAAEVVTARPQVLTASQEVLTAHPQVLTVGLEVSTASPQVSTSGLEVLTASPQVSTAGLEVSTASPQVSTAGQEVSTASPLDAAKGDE